MEQPQSWVEALNISPKKLNEWTALAPDGVPVLVYVLQEGHVSMEAYLAWASEHYHLPVLNDQYFETVFDADAARNLQFSAGFECKPWLFPIENWDGTLFVACHAPPEEPLEGAVRMVLADPRTLQSVWSNMASAVTSTKIGELGEVVTEEPPANEVPAGFAPLDAKPFKLNLDDLNEDNLFRKELPPEAPAPAPAAKSAPAPAPAPKAKPAPTPAPAAKAAPPPPAAAEQKPALREESLATELPDDEGSKIHLAPPIPTARSEKPSAPPSLKPLKAAEELPAQPAPEPAPAQPAAQAATEIKVPSLKPKNKPGKAPKVKSKIPILTTEQQNEAIEMAFSQMKTIYRHMFLMRVADGQAKLHKWDDTLAPASSKPVVVDLVFPTFLRIISKTLMPYHGYLVDSPAHREFFSALQINELPGCVTAIPIKDGNNLLGVLVGVGDENLQKLDILRKAEEASETLVDALAPTWAKVA